MKRQTAWRRWAQGIAIAGLAVGLCTAASAAAQPQAPGRRGPGGPGGMMRPPPFAHLKLSDDQRTKIHALFADQREETWATREKVRTAHDELRSAIYGSTAPDTARIDELVAQIVELTAQQLKSRTSLEIRLAALLTDEQRQQMATARRGPEPRPGGPIDR